MKTIITDFHMHSVLSGDAADTLEDMVTAALEQGCKYAAVTEHCNTDYHTHGYSHIKTTDLEVYGREFKALKKKFEGQIEIAYGLEIGYDALSNEKNLQIIKRYDYDYIINSIHIIKGDDCYWEHYFEKRTQKEGYENYLKAVYESLSAPYRFNSIGHLGYITRNSPFDSRDMLTGYKDLVEMILKKMIGKGVCLELNTSIRTAPGPCLPQTEIVRFYRDLGGELIIYGSDAHTVSDVCRGRAAVMAVLKDCGFKYHTVFIGKEMKLLPI